MSDVPTAARDLEPGAGEPEMPSSSVGHYLAGQRRLRGISIEELSNRTRIPRRNIERLEAGAFDAAPDGFSRGFVRTVALALGLDADEAVMRLMSEPLSDDSMLLRERRMSFMLRGALFLGVLLVGMATWKLLVAMTFPIVSEAEPQVVYWRDPVKLLAADPPELPPRPGTPSVETATAELAKPAAAGPPAELATPPAELPPPPVSPEPVVLPKPIVLPELTVLREPAELAPPARYPARVAPPESDGD